MHSIVGSTLQLDTLPLSLKDRRRVQALAVPGAAPTSGASEDGELDDASSPAPSDVVRVDIWVDETDAVQATKARPHAHPLLHWLNDVSDSTSASSPYRGWSSSLNGLLRPSWQLHPIALNLYSAVLVGDLSTEAALKSIATAGFLSAARIPIRFGLIALPGPDDAAALDGNSNPLPAPIFDASASGLQIALLHAEALMELGADCGASFVSGLGAAFQSRLAAAQEQAAASEDGGNTRECFRSAQ